MKMLFFFASTASSHQLDIKGLLLAPSMLLVPYTHWSPLFILMQFLQVSLSYEILL